MTNSHSLLSQYQALVQNHTSQFDPEIAALQELVAQRMKEIQNSEQDLLTAQTIELKRITDALATDARCLLPTSEFRAFVQEYQRTERDSWYRQKSEPQISQDPSTWLLGTLELPISLSNYKTEEDPDGYDDERTHTVYSYSLSLKLGDWEQKIEVPYKRVYNIHECNEYSIKDQIDDYILGDVEDLLSETNYGKAEQNQLAYELSILVGYTTQIFALTPRTAIFEYKSK